MKVIDGLTVAGFGVGDDISIPPTFFKLKDRKISIGAGVVTFGVGDEDKILLGIDVGNDTVMAFVVIVFAIILFFIRTE